MPHLAPGADTSLLGGEFVLLDATGTTLRGLNATAAQVWALIDGHRTVAAIASNLARDFQAPLADVERDVVAFLAHLLDRRLIRLEGSTL